MDDTHLVVDLGGGLQEIGTVGRVQAYSDGKADVIQDIRVPLWKRAGDRIIVVWRNTYVTQRNIDGYGAEDDSKMCSSGRGAWVRFRQRFASIQFEPLRMKLSR